MKAEALPHEPISRAQGHSDIEGLDVKPRNEP
jgi:hypothetical protein